MSDVRNTLWKLFEQTGSVHYYLMYRAVQDGETPRDFNHEGR